MSCLLYQHQYSAWLVILILFLLPGKTCQAQFSDSTQISLITCRPGDEIYNTFGHTAIRVTDPATKLDVLFNYGMFSFDDPNFTMKFLRGKLMYWLGTERYRGFINNYSEQKRSLIEQKLNLSLDQKLAILSDLQVNMKDENRYYLYDFFFDNCSTRPRDVLERHCNLVYESVGTVSSYRELLDLYLMGKPWTDFGIDLIIGSIADKKAEVRDQMFLPEQLMIHMASAKINGETELVAEEKLLTDYESHISRRNQHSFFTPLILFALLLLLELVLFLKFRGSTSKFILNYDKIWFLLAGLSSVVLLFMWLGTDHIATKVNMNVLWLSPLYFIFLNRKSPSIHKKIQLILLLIALIQSLFFQAFHPAFYLMIAILFLKILRNTVNSPE